MDIPEGDLDCPEDITKTFLLGTVMLNVNNASMSAFWRLHGIIQHSITDGILGLQYACQFVRHLQAEKDELAFGKHVSNMLAGQEDRACESLFWQREAADNDSMEAMLEQLLAKLEHELCFGELCNLDRLSEVKRCGQPHTWATEFANGGAMVE